MVGEEKGLIKGAEFKPYGCFYPQWHSVDDDDYNNDNDNCDDDDYIEDDDDDDDNDDDSMNCACKQSCL